MTAGSARETWVRDQFPALRSGEARMDGPAGSQVPVPVIRAMVRYLEADNANSGGLFSASVSTDSLIGRARDAMAGFLGCRPEEVGFGQNASTVNLLLSRAAVRSLRPGDEIVVTRLDHDSNIDPWLEGAKDVGAKVVMVDARDDTTLDMDGLAAAIGERTRVVAFPWACNATGTMTDVAQISAMAHAAGALGSGSVSIGTAPTPRYTGLMPRRSRKPADLNRLAAAILDEATDEDRDPYEGKNPAAVELGRLGGQKGGKARAAKLTPEQRSEIAKKAAAARWGRL